MVIWYWSALEADLLRYYGMDINAIPYDESWRKVSNLIYNLPPDSAFMRMVQDKKSRSFAEWSENAIAKNA